MKESELSRTTLGAYTRLKTEPGEQIVKYFYYDRSARTAEQFGAYVRMTMAHVVMEAEEKIIPANEAAQILAALREVEAMGVEGFPLNPRLTETVLQVENYIVTRTGPEVGGNVHIGRSRCDLSPSILRLALRTWLLRILDKVGELRGVMLDLAGEHVETVMPAYTHFQHAQCITFGHYLISVADELERDLDRLWAAYRRTNQSPLGTAATAATSWPLNRLRIAELLGFEGLVENSRDAGVAKDYALEALSALAILMGHVCRVATDLWIWETYEFGMVELADEYTGTSSAMPQKKNPYPLEVMRFRYSQIVGDLMTAFTVNKGPNEINSESLLFETSMEPVMHACRYALDTLDFLAGVVSTLIVKPDRMRELAAGNFAQALELADRISQTTDVSWRTAHHIVGKVVAMAIDAKIKPVEVTSEMIDRASIEIIERPLNLPAEVVRKAMDPLENARSRTVIGGPAPSEVVRMLEGRQRNLAAEQAKLDAEVGRLNGASAALDSAVNGLLS